MGDPMMRGGGMPQGGPPGMPPGGPPPGGSLKMPANSSIFNPTDAAVMSGQFSQNMTVRDALTKLGIDVDGPATQLVQFTKSQMQNRTMAGKLGARPQGPSQGMPQGMPQGGAPPSMPQAEPGGMEGLMSKLRG